MKTKTKIIQGIVYFRTKVTPVLPLPDNNSRDISRYIYNFLLYFKTVVFIPLFLFESLTIVCGTLFQKR